MGMLRSVAFAFILLMISGLALAVGPGLILKDPNTFRQTYKCKYDGYRKYRSVVRFSADGDERPVYLKIDKGWRLDKKNRLFTKSEQGKEMKFEGKSYEPRFVNSTFVIDELMLTREHGFIGGDVDYISYYECFEIQ